jgi:hypothetical protein
MNRLSAVNAVDLRRLVFIRAGLNPAPTTPGHGNCLYDGKILVGAGFMPARNARLS